MDVSLFRRLSDAHPDAVVDLTYQYRMNEDIMLLSNRLIYSDRLKCGSKEVAEKALVLPQRDKWEKYHISNSSCVVGDCWMACLLDERLATFFICCANLFHQTYLLQL